MTNKNVFSFIYVVENWIKIVIVFSLSNRYSFLTYSQKCDYYDWNLALTLQSDGKSMKFSFFIIFKLLFSMFATNRSTIHIFSSRFFFLWGKTDIWFCELLYVLLSNSYHLPVDILLATVMFFFFFLKAFILSHIVNTSLSCSSIGIFI